MIVIDLGRSNWINISEHRILSRDFAISGLFPEA